jgi:hypothetical protein
MEPLYVFRKAKRKGALSGAFLFVETVAVILLEELDRRFNHRVCRILHRLLQASNAELLHAAVGQGDVTHFVVRIDRPRPAARVQADRVGDNLLSRRITGRGGIAGTGGTLGANVHITIEQHLRIGFLGIIADEETDFADEEVAIACVTSAEVRCRRRVERIRRAAQHFRSAQFIGHDLEHPGDTRLYRLGWVDHRGAVGMVNPFISATLLRIHSRGVTIAVITFPHTSRQTALFEIVNALDAQRARLGFRQRGEQHSRQNRDDGDDDQQFDERERPYFTEFLHMTCFGFVSANSLRTLGNPLLLSTRF